MVSHPYIRFSKVILILVFDRLCDYKVMARVANKIKLIDGSREALKLSIRITDLWFIGIPKKSEQAEMVGDEIHVVCKQDQLKSRKVGLKENLTYVMHNFKVMKNDGKFRVCDHEYKLCFTRVTVVRQSDMEHLPFRKFKFIDFSSVIAGHFQTGLLVDVIGVVDEVVFRYVSSKNTRVVFKLKDLSGQVLSCTLWENYCLQFLSYLNEVEDERPIVILLTHARIKEAQGSYPPSVTNSFKASKFMINNLVLEIQEFRERKSNVSFFKQEIVCVTVDKITTIVMDNYSWCYPACDQCYKKDDIETVPFTCPCGKENDQPVLRYRVEVMVNHKGEQTKFLIWDRECAQLIGQSADEVNRLKIEDGDVDLNASPQALDRLLGCFLAFKVKVQPRFRNSIVLKYSDESDLVNAVLDMLPDSELYPEPNKLVRPAIVTMPEHSTRQTSLERLEEAVHKLTQHQATLAQNNQTLTQANADLTLKLDSVLDRLAALTTTPSSPQPPPSSPPPHIPCPHMKLEVPCFDGQDPLGWIFKIQQFFDYQGVFDAD
ncbi:hypothetical protein AAZX31_03G048500 [Glycine max]